MHWILFQPVSAILEQATMLRKKIGAWMSSCLFADEEQRIKVEKGETMANFVENAKKKKKPQNKLKPVKTITKTSTSTDNKPFKFKCYFCKKVGHMKKDYSGYKNWLVKKGIHKEESPKK
uniref:uncharacterized protein LOC105352441 n=1 Tax=Fragaria vesca subsp. vesca TaxID=101020 RepID=UPI0005C90C51|nr:PREDICTED: uncharacterized protein LOC105352441 [Fragaria vesca subsp. vesca]